MLSIPHRSSLARLCLSVSLTVSMSAPAFADHLGPSGFGGGGGLSVFGPDTLDEGHAALGLRLIYTRPEDRSVAELEALAGAGIHAHNTDYNLNASLGAAYGITHQLTVSAELPYVRRDHLREAEASDEIVGLGSVSGIGDLSLLAKYRLFQSDGSGLALIGGLKLPTGGVHERSRDGERLETEHQPGTGSWDPIAGASAGIGLGPVQLAASALYQFSGNGAQHTRLGDRFQGGVAVSHRFSSVAPHPEETGRNHHHGDELDEHAEHGHASWDAFVELSGEWEGRQTIAGQAEAESGGRSLWLAPGARFNSAGGLSVGASLALPMWQQIRASHPDNRYRLSLSVAHAF